MISLLKKHHPLASAVSLACMVLAPLATAAPGSLSDLPLTFVVAPQPNILVVLDDSGSMSNRQVIRQEAQIELSLGVDGTASSFTEGNLSEFFDGATTDIEIREFCRGVNTLAYDPSVKYEPWIGKNNAGDEYIDRTLHGSTRLLTNPYTRAPTFNNVEPFYVDWDDKGPDGTGEADGIYQNGECGGPISNYEVGKEAGHVFNLDSTVDQVTTLTYGVLYDDGGVKSNYTRNKSTFAINVAPGGSLKFTLVYANLDGGDTLKIYKGADETGSLIKTLDGNLKIGSGHLNNNEYYSIEETFTVSGSDAFIVFDVDDLNEREGFKLTWRHTSATSVTNVESSVIDNMVTGEDCSGQCVLVSSLPATEAFVVAGAKYPYNTQQNYANWYTYYRNRSSVSTKALSDVIDESESRIGLATINGKKGARIQSMSVADNKDALLQRLFDASGSPSGQTPLKGALMNAGKYFHANDQPAANFFGSGVSATHPSSDFTVTTNTPILNAGRGGQCQQNFTLVFSDGAYSDPDAVTVLGEGVTTVGNADGDGLLSGDVPGSDFDKDLYGDIYDNTMADIAMAYFENDISPDGTDEGALASGLDDALSLSVNNQIITHQHMSTYMVGFGAAGTLSGIPTSYELDGEGEPKVDGSLDNIIIGLWPEAIAGKPSAIDDMRHAAFNGRGEFFSAFEPQKLIADINNVISAIADRVENTGTGAAFSSFELSSESQLFKVVYSSESWWGDVQSFRFDDLSGVFESTYEWSADEQMTARATRATDRQIITYNGREGIPFQFPATFTDLVEVTNVSGGVTKKATLNSVQVSDLLRYVDPDSTAESQRQAYGEDIVSYLRGDDTHDGTLFRDRFDHYLGAFVHSQPQYVGVPSRPYPDNIETSSYSSFASANKYRRPIVYASGNDGMLHGFYASSTYDTIDGKVTSSDTGGSEVFAYVPGLVSDADNGGNGLSEMAQPSYTNKPYVDGTATVSDVFVDSDNDGTRDTWRTYLASGLRGGGKGIYVVDVTDPAVLLTAEGDDGSGNSHANQITVMEFTHDDLGFVYGRPQIAKMNNGRWAAIVPSGYNNYPEGDGTSKLFIIYVDGYDDPTYSGGTADGKVDYDILEASAHSWTNCAAEGADCTLSSAAYVRYGVGGEYFYQDMPAGEFTCNNSTFGDPVIDTLKSCDYSDVDANGLSTPTVIDTNSDLIADKIYAGDLHGNLWVFNVSATNSSGWGVDDNNLSDSSRTPLFTACDAALVGGLCSVNDRQAITSRPVVLSHPLQNASATDPNTLVFFGTGQYVSEIDKADTKQQSFYGVWDAGTAHRGLHKSAGFIEQDISLIGVTQSRALSDKPVNYTADAGSANIYGWYMDFPNSSPGERVVIRPVVVNDIIFFATLIPEEGLCTISAGSSYLMAAKLINGGPPSVDVFEEGLDPTHGYTAGQFVEGVIVGLDSTATKEGVSVRADQSDGTSVTTSTVSGGSVEAGRKSWSILR